MSTHLTKYDINATKQMRPHNAKTLLSCHFLEDLTTSEMAEKFWIKDHQKLLEE